MNWKFWDFFNLTPQKNKNNIKSWINLTKIIIGSFLASSKKKKKKKDMHCTPFKFGQFEFQCLKIWISSLEV
jgi:hypothetical protein